MQVSNYHALIQLSKDVCVTVDKENDGMEDDGTTEKKERWETELQEFDPSKTSLKQFQKKMQRKARKENNRNKKRTDDLTAAFESFSGLKESTDDYDFNDYFGK